ncbi:MAG TPA: hypothetical protein VFS08_07715 [Gemmatimonadaceae bacterium]|nr:hypothetical protein [Gemmatimonadaceae bacterium]
MRSWIATTLILAVAACSAPAPRLTPAPDPSIPLDAQLFPPYYGQVAVHLTKPAYIAVFEIVPGRGVSMLYPQSGSGFQQTDEVWVPMHYSPQRWLYASGASTYSGFGMGRYGFASYAGRSYYGDGYGVADRFGAPPRYLFLVASEEPLDVAQFQGSGTAIRTYLGLNDYAGYEPYELMERLAYAVLPFVSADGWVSDVYVDWGYDWGYGVGPGMTAAMASYRTVRCPDGTLGTGRYLAGWGWEVPPCLNRSVIGTPQLPPVGPPVGDDSSAAPTEPGRSRAASPDTADRRRRTPDQEPRTAPPPSPDQMRRRIAELRADASRLHFRDELSRQVQRGVTVRQAIVERMPPGDDPFRPTYRSTRAERDESTTRQRNADLQRRREAARRDVHPSSTRGSSVRGSSAGSTRSTPRARPSSPRPRASAPSSRGSSRPEASAPRTRSSPPSTRSAPSSSKQGGETRKRPPTQ